MHTAAPINRLSASPDTLRRRHTCVQNGMGASAASQNKSASPMLPVHSQSVTSVGGGPPSRSTNDDKYATQPANRKCAPSAHPNPASRDADSVHSRNNPG